MIDASNYLLEETPWAEHAACAGQPADLWFPDRGEKPIVAQAICATCPVTDECLAYALRWRIPHGIWGGTTSRQRRRLADGVPRLRRLPPPHGGTARYHIGCRCSRCVEAQMAYLAEYAPERRR